MTAKHRLGGYPLAASRRTHIDPALVLDAVAEIQPTLQFSPWQIAVGAESDPTIVVTEHERKHVIPLSALIDRLERDAIPTNPSAIRQAVRCWIDTRPVTDATAAEKGIATLGWTRGESRANWQVVVPRQTGAVMAWVPTVHTSAETVRQVRADALLRARQLTITPVVVGAVTLWAYLVNPALSTAVLSQTSMLAETEPIEDLYAVFAPDRPVAVATRSAATRLSEESTEPHTILPLASLNQIDWN